MGFFNKFKAGTPKKEDSSQLSGTEQKQKILDEMSSDNKEALKELLINIDDPKNHVDSNEQMGAIGFKLENNEVIVDKEYYEALARPSEKEMKNTENTRETLEDEITRLGNKINEKDEDTEAVI
ncbi:hypothetical protein K8R66_01840 [bacterium]|nr:hypothetical protein [bacterium]